MSYGTHQAPDETAPLLSTPLNAATAFDTAFAGPLVDAVIDESDEDSDTETEARAGGSKSQPHSAGATVAALGKEAKIIIGYSVPVLITQLLEYSLSIASVISIGHLSTVELAASTLGSMTAAVTGWSIIIGMVSALDTLLPQAWGGPPEHRFLVGLWTQRMTVVIAIILVPIVIIWHSSHAILLFLRQDEDVAYYASIYLKWLSIGIPAYAFNYITRKYYQSIGLLHVPSVLILVIAPLNALLNWILVWGPGPFAPIRLGFIGAPIASAFSYNLISVGYLVHAYVWAPREAWHPISDAKSLGEVFKSEALGFLVRLGAAGVGQTASEWWSWELVGLAASLLGPVTLASQSVLLVSASTSYQLSFAISAAASVRIGNLVGSGNAFRARAAAYVALLLVMCTGSFSSMVFLIFRKSWGYLFNGDAEVVNLVAEVLPLVALFQILDGLGSMTGSILRLTGMQFTGALLNLTGYYVIGIPIGLIITFWYPAWNLGLLGLWIGLSIALSYTSVIGLWYSLRTDWSDEVEKAKLRLKAGDHAIGIGH